MFNRTVNNFRSTLVFGGDAASSRARELVAGRVEAGRAEAGRVATGRVEAGGDAGRRTGCRLSGRIGGVSS